MHSLKEKLGKLRQAQRLVRDAEGMILQARPRRAGVPCLVTNLAQLGDVALSAGVAAALRERLPDAPLLFACERRWRDVVEGDPAFDGLLHPDSFHAVRALARSGLFPQVYVLDIPMPSLLDYFDGVPAVHRYAPPTTADWPAYGKNLMTLYEQNAGLPEGAARPRIWIRPEDHAHVARLWRDEGLDGPGPVFALHTQSALDSKTWPPERFASLAERWHRREGVRFVVVGGPGEAGALVGVPGVVHLAGRLTLKQTAAAIAACDLFIGLDSGLAYFAESAGTPGLILLGATAQQTCGPRSPDFSFVRAPGACDPACHFYCSRPTLCITSLTEGIVDDALGAAWARAGLGAGRGREAACAFL